MFKKTALLLADVFPKRGERKIEKGDFHLYQLLRHVFLYKIKMRSKRDATKVKGKQGVMYINLDGGGGERMVENLKEAVLPSFRRRTMSVDGRFKRGVSLSDGFPLHGRLHFQVTKVK